MSRASDLHRDAMTAADFAIMERLKGNHEVSLAEYRRAFRFEREAAAEAMREGVGEPTISVLQRSAATLALEAGEVREAERLVAAALAKEPPEDIANELRDLLENVYFRRHLDLRGIKLLNGEFQFSMSGPAVGFGIAPSDEYVGRVTNVETLLYRTAERHLNYPYRERGRRKNQLSEDLSLYVTVPRAASFAVTFRLGAPIQGNLWGQQFAEEVVDEVLTCLDMLNRGEDRAVRERINDPAYFANFVGLAKKIAPDGKKVTGVGFTAPTEQTVREIAFKRRKDELPSPVTRDEDQVDAELVAQVPLVGTDDAVEAVTIVGRLAYADELLDHNEIRVEPDVGGSAIRIQVPRGLMSDIVKPMWGQRVVLKANKRGEKFEYVDIDEAE